MAIGISVNLTADVRPFRIGLWKTQWYHRLWFGRFRVVRDRPLLWMQPYK